MSDANPKGGAKGMRLDIEPPIHGGAKIWLKAEGVDLQFVTSYVPYDSIGDLARAIVDMLTGLPEQVVTWSLEPAEYDFRFATADGRTRLQVYQYPDFRRRWRRQRSSGSHGRRRNRQYRSCHLAGVAAFARGGSGRGRSLRRGRGPFPAAAVERIGDLLRGRRRKRSRE